MCSAVYEPDGGRHESAVWETSEPVPRGLAVIAEDWNDGMQGADEALDALSKSLTTRSCPKEAPLFRC